MMADKLLNAQDLITAKKHDTFRSEVITGKAGGISTGANIDYATNAVTGQVQKTLPKVIDDIDWSYVGKFADGVTFTKKSDFAIDANGTQWIYTGNYPFTATAGTVPSEPTYQVVHVKSASVVTNSKGGSVQDFIDDQEMFHDSLVPFKIYPENGICNIGDTIPASPVYSGVRTSFGEYQADQALSGVITAISQNSITVGGVDFELTILSNVFAKRIEAPYVIAVTKSLLQEAVDKAVASTKPYPQINNATNSGSIVIDLGGSAVVIDRPIELPSGAGGYTFANGLIAPNVSNFPVGENLIEYVGVGDHPLIGFFNLQLECARIANGMYVNRYIENWATGLRIHGQKDWGIRIGSDLGFEFNTGAGCTIAEYYNNEAGFLAPTSTGLLIDVGGAADNQFNALVVKYCKKQFDIGSQANKFNGCHFYGTGADQYNSNGRSVIRGNAKRNQFNGSYFDTTGLEIQNPSQMQILGGRFAAASSVNGSSYVHLNAITANHNLDALLIRDNIFAIIGNYQADAFSWTGTIGRIRDTDVSNNSVDLQGGVGDSPSIDMRSTKAFKRVFGNGVNALSAQFNNVLLWDANIQRVIGLTAEMSNIQPYSVTTSGRNVNLSLPASQFSNITLRTSVDVSSHYSETADQYPL